MSGEGPGWPKAGLGKSVAAIREASTTDLMRELTEGARLELARVSVLRDNPSPPNVLLEIDEKKIVKCQCR